MGSAKEKDRGRVNRDLPSTKINYDECEVKSSVPLDVPARVDRVHVDGLSRTKNDVAEGATRDLLSARTFREVLSKAHEARVKLEKSGCFGDISVHVDASRGPKATPDGVEVTFYVHELSRVVGGVTTEVGRDEGSVVLGVRAPNVLGRGERLFVEYGYGSRRSNHFGVGVVKPFLGEHEPSLSVSAHQCWAEFAASGYEELSKGGVVDFGFFSAPALRHNVQYKGVVRNTSALRGNSSFDTRESSGPSLKSALQHTLGVDLRDDRIFPSCGSLTQLVTEIAGLGGDVGFIKNELYVQGNYPLPAGDGGVVFQVTGSAGLLKGLGSGMRVGLSDMFYLGGPLDVRGFQARGIGSRAESDALGADAFWSGGVHLFTPLPFTPGKGGFGDIFRTHLFVNSGNVASFKNEETLINQLTKNVRVSAGLGVAIRIGQMARVEVNYCFPIKYAEGDQVQPGVQFGLGFQFS